MERETRVVIEGVLMPSSQAAGPVRYDLVTDGEELFRLEDASGLLGEGLLHRRLQIDGVVEGTGRGRRLRVVRCWPLDDGEADDLLEGL